jgi:hypothetical protein
MDGARTEPGWADIGRQASRLARRARRRPALVAACTLAATAAVVTVVARRPMRPRVAVVLRMTETQPGVTRLGWTDRALRGYVTEVAFSQARLRELIRRRHLFRSAIAQEGMDGAVALLRDRITVEVVQNHVIALIPPRDRPHSAHVRIAFEDADPVRGLEVAKDLGRLVESTGEAQRRADLAATLHRWQAGAERSRAEIRELRTQAAVLAVAAPNDAAAAARLQSLREALRIAEARLDREEQSRIAARLALHAEVASGALEIELLPPPPPPPEPRRAVRCAAAGAAGLAFALPITVLLIGAFDRRVYLPEDLRDLGLRYLGRWTPQGSGLTP